MNKTRLVIIDDDIAGIKTLIRILSDGYHVMFAHNGEDGLKLIRTHHPDLILLDISLPDKSGIEICRELKANPSFSDIPVVFMTGRDDDETMIQAFEAGGSDFIFKPYNRFMLQARVRVHVALARQLRDLLALKEQYEDEIEVRNEVERELIDKRRALELEVSLRQRSQEELNRYAEALENAKSIQEQTTAELYYANEHIRNVLADKERINNELSRANATKDRLFSVIAHDLKGGVGNIGAVLDLICSERISPEEQGEFLKELRKSAHALFTLLEEVLLWSRQQRDMVRFSPDILCAKDLLLSVVQSAKSQAETKRVILSFFAENKTCAFADHFMIQSVMRNLAQNAIKFTASGGIVELGAKPDPDSAEWVLFYVKDNGVGIRDEDKPKIFQDGALFTTRGTDSEAGTGLGLGICREFVQRNSGAIWFESTLGEGTTFWVKLQAGHTEICEP
jgi:two-component system, sensor histidine kinase and response regulator